MDRVNVKDAAVAAHLKEDALVQKLLKELTAAEEQIKQLIRVSVHKERDPRLQEFHRARDEAKQKLKTRHQEVLPLIEQQMRTRAIEEYQTHLTQLRERVAFYEGLVKSLEDEVQKIGGASAAEDARTLREEIATGSETLRKLGAETDRAEDLASDLPAVSASEEAPTLQRKKPERRWQLAGLGGAGFGRLARSGSVVARGTPPPHHVGERHHRRPGASGCRQYPKRTEWAQDYGGGSRSARECQRVG